MTLSEIEFYKKDDKLLVAYSGRKRIANEGLDLSQGEGVYVTDYILSFDMALDSISYVPETLHKGKDTTLNIQIANLGLTSSPACEVEVWKDDVLMGVTNAISLAAGESGVVTYSVTMQDVETNLKFVIIGNSGDVESANDVMDYNLKIKPDFIVKKLKK